MEVQSTETRETVLNQRGFSSWRWEISATAIFSGAIVSLGLLILFLLFGTALGLTLIDPYQVTKNENTSSIGSALIAWVLLSTLASIYMGAWYSAHVARLGAESALMQGVAVWGVCIIVVALALGHHRFTQSPNPAHTRELADSYGSLSDPEFFNFLLMRARNWKPGTTEQAPAAAIDNEVRDRSNKIPGNSELRHFVQANTSLSKAQTEEFLEQNKLEIYSAQVDAQKRWDARHAVELAEVDRHRHVATTLATLFSIAALLSLFLALAGSYVGWLSRDHPLFHAAYHNSIHQREPKVS